MGNITKFVLWACLLANGLPCAAAEIDGIWSSVSRSKGGLGSQWVFADGRANYSFGALVDFTYKVSGPKLEMTFTEAGGRGESSKQEFLIDGDTLTLDPNNPERRQIMKRVRGGPSRESIVGEWTYKHYTGGPAFMRYSNNGQGQLVVPMKTMDGNYTIDNDRVLISLPSENISVTGSLGAGSLSIRDEQGRETRFKRFER